MENKELLDPESNLVTNVLPIVHATIVDILIDDNQKARYKLAIDTGNYGTVYSWHRYSTYCRLADILKTKKAYNAKVIPELPKNCCSVDERMVALNKFFRAIARIKDLHWGIRIDCRTTAIYRGDILQSRPSNAPTTTCSDDEDE